MQSTWKNDTGVASGVVSCVLYDKLNAHSTKEINEMIWGHMKHHERDIPLKGVLYSMMGPDLSGLTSCMK